MKIHLFPITHSIKFESDILNILPRTLFQVAHRTEFPKRFWLFQDGYRRYTEPKFFYVSILFRYFERSLSF